MKRVREALTITGDLVHLEGNTRDAIYQTTELGKQKADQWLSDYSLPA